MTEEQIKHIVERFLQWKLPKDFNPDGGISFEPMINEHTNFPSRREPSGTNLLHYDQAEEMVRFIVADLAAPTDAEVRFSLQYWNEFCPHRKSLSAQAIEHLDRIICAATAQKPVIKMNEMPDEIRAWGDGTWRGASCDNAIVAGLTKVYVLKEKKDDVAEKLAELEYLRKCIKSAQRELEYHASKLEAANKYVKEC